MQGGGTASTPRRAAALAERHQAAIAAPRLIHAFKHFARASQRGEQRGKGPSSLPPRGAWRCLGFAVSGTA